MAVIHKTTLTPGKLELLAAWLPSQPWYEGGDRHPELARAGGFRLDDPRGEVGIEFMVVTDDSGDEPLSYLVPLTYRGRRSTERIMPSSAPPSTGSSDRGGSTTAPMTRSSSHNFWRSSRARPSRRPRA